MNLKESIESDFIECYKQRDEERISILRMIKSAIKNAEIEAKTELDNEAVIKVLQREIKLRDQSASEYRKGNRPELAEKEEKENEIIKTYLPEQLDDAELTDIIKQTIMETGASGPSDFGKVISEVINKSAGRADGSRISNLVRTLINSK